MSGPRAGGLARRPLTIGLLGLITAAAFEGMAVPTVMPAMVADLGRLDLYGWAFSAFWLTNIVGITLAGTDADRAGPARAFAVGVVLFAAGLLIAGLAPDMVVVIAGRAVQGLGAGAIGAIVYVVIARAYEGPQQPRMIAATSSAWVVPGLVGPALAGLIAESIGWRWVFLGIVPPLLVLGALPVRQLLRLPPAGHPPRGAMRRLGRAVVLAIGSTLAIGGLGLGIGAEQPWVGGALVVVGGGAAIVGLRPLVPPGTLIAAPGRPAVIATIFAFTFAFFGVEAFVPLAVSTVREAGTIAGGLALSAAAVTWASGSWLAARIATSPAGRRRPQVAAGLVGIAAGTVVVALALLPGAPIWLAVVGWAVAGLGMGTGYSTLSLLVIETAPPGEEGAASAALQLMFTLGTAFGAGVGGAVVAMADRGLLPLAMAIGVVDAIMILVALIGLAGALRTPGRAPRGPEPAEEAMAVALARPLD